MSDNSGIKVILKDDETTELTFRVYPSGQPNHPQAKSATLKLVRILKGFWLNENDEELTQTDGLNKDAFYGQKVKIKLLTSHTKDGKIIEVEIKAKKGDEYIDLADEQETLKLTLKAKNNEAISEPFYLNPKWYNEEKENYNYDAHQTEIEPSELLTFVFDAKYKGQDKEHGRIDLPKDDTLKLKPVTYLRNYEELIGLFNTDNSGTKDKENNYENKFIDSNSEIKTVVDEFIEKVIGEDITTSEIKTLVEEKAKALWKTSVKQVQSGNLDDRPLYWARNKMQTWLKRNSIFKDQIDFEKSLVKKGTELDNIIILFEELSRNYTGIDFSKTGNKKKVLITGFDPFILNSFKHPNIKGNILQSNPSGCVALNVENWNIENVFVQTLIVPVRYKDFDSSQESNNGQGKGIIEKYIGKLINEVDMIITISQAGPKDYNIDKYATATRGGFNDNLDFTRVANSHALITKDEWIETTLPTEMTNAPFVKYNWTYDGKDGKNNPPKLNQKISYGPGGSYLSNEIFYRVAKLRKDSKPKLNTGHFHIAKIQDPNEDLKSQEIKEVIFIVKNGIKEGIKKI